jgi:hypothetical protein
MRLEDLTVALRPRQPWEAVDLGCAMTRRDYGRVILLWLITVMPVWIVLGVLLWDQPMWFSLAAWWLKPLYDRVPLFHLSRAAFGSRPTVKETLREWPRLWSRFLLPALLWRRLSFIRSFALPVLMLEGQKGKAASQRVTTLAMDGGSSGASLSWVFIKLEIAVWLGLSALASSLGPADGLPDFSSIVQDPESYFQTTNAQQWFSNVLYLIAMTIIEPFYVGAGFGLYLNSRTKLEGWDIELTFRRLAARLRPVVVALLAFAFALPGMISAADAQPTVVTEEVSEAKKAVREILTQEEFKEHSRTTPVWVPAASETNAGIGGLFAILLWVLGYAALAALLGYVIWWLVQYSRNYTNGPRSPRTHAPEAAPRVIMGMAITRDSLPEDIVAAARAAWTAGNVREALSLLYRGALSRLVEQRRLAIRDSDTEDDCLMKAADVVEGPVMQFFRQLTLVWVRAAYAGKEAEPAEFETLCRTWPFSNNAPAPRGQNVIVQAMLIASVMLLSSCDGTWEDVTIPLGYKGKARTDPFLAAQQLLIEEGHYTERLPTLKALPESDGGVIIISAEAGMPEARARQLLQWAGDGGHLIYAMAGCAPYNDWGLFSSGSTYGYTGNTERKDPILEGMKVKMLGLDTWLEKVLPDYMRKRLNKKDGEKKKDDDAKAKKAEDKKAEEIKPAPKAEEPKKEPEAKKDETKEPKTKEPAKKKPRIKEPEDVPTQTDELQADGKTYKLTFPSIVHLQLDRKLRSSEWAVGKDGKHTALSLIHGHGRVTLLNHARPFRNRFIDDGDHAQLLVDLVGDDAQHVQFIVPLGTSFWALLWKRAWMPLIGLALLTVVWLWIYLPRFGPQRQVVLHDTKHFFEHISALGGFFHRMRRGDILLAAAADAVRARATRLYPHLIHHNDSAIIEILTERSDLPEPRIRAAFEAAEKPATRDFVRHIQDLQSLKNSLH